MALHSRMAPLGGPLPDITLPDLAGEPVQLRDLAANRPLVVVFACNHCPYVRHVEIELARVSSDFAERGVAFVAISSNDVDNYPDDDAEGLREQVRRTGWTFPYLMDTDQSAAKTFQAACTPDFFVYNRMGRLAYRGALDASTPKNGQPLDGADLRAALTTILDGGKVPEPHRPSMGCGIKWKPGNEPEAVTFI